MQLEGKLEVEGPFLPPPRNQREVTMNKGVDHEF